MNLIIRVSIVVGLIIVAAPLFSEEFVLVTPSADYRATEENVNRAVDPQLSSTDMVNAHDQVRNAVNAGTQVGPAGGVSGAGFQPIPNPLIGGVSWDATVATSAQSWSDSCNFSHPGGHPYGENLYASTSTLAPPIVWAEADAVVDSWAAESADYDYGTNAAIPPGTAVVGHYTQVVWADSRMIGCGATQCTVNSPWSDPQFSNWVSVVCRYDAPGNYVGVRPYCTAQYPDDCALPVELLTFGVE